MKMNKKNNLRKFIFLLLTLVSNLAFSETFKEFYDEGVRLAADGRRDESILHLQQGLEKEWSDKNWRILLNYLGTLNVRKNPELALTYFRQAILTPCSNETEYYRTFNHLGQFYRFHGQLEAAIGAFSNVASRRHAHPSLVYFANFAIAQMYEQLERPEAAIRHYKSAVEAGKRVPYKYNYQPAVEALQKLKENEGTK